MKIAMCCVADEKPKYLTQALRWARAIRLFGPPADVFLGLTDPLPASYASEFRQLGVSQVPVPRASFWHGPSNKLGVLLNPRLRYYDYVVLSDCDIAVAGDFSKQLLPGRIRAKPADLATLSNVVLERVFARAGQPIPPPQLRTTIDHVLLHPYCNTGFVVFPGELVASFTKRWLHCNQFVLAHPELLGEHTFFTDQASFALALAEHLDRFLELPVEMNFPCHVERRFYPPELHRVEPIVLHYHDRVQSLAGPLLRTGLPGPDRVIDRVNGTLSAELGDFRDPDSYRDARFIGS